MILQFITSKSCTPCKAAKPHVKKFCEELDITVQEINRDLMPGVVFAKKVKSVPTFILLNDEKIEVNRMEGFGSIDILRRFLQER